jgi:hypothetical protein
VARAAGRYVYHTWRRLTDGQQQSCPSVGKTRKNVLALAELPYGQLADSASVVESAETILASCPACGRDDIPLLDDTLAEHTPAEKPWPHLCPATRATLEQARRLAEGCDNPQ